jgi:hypothetical protein
MSKLKDLSYDIEALFIDGETASAIAEQLNCPISLVKSTLKTFGVDERDIEEDYGQVYQGEAVFASMVKDLA